MDERVYLGLGFIYTVQCAASLPQVKQLLLYTGHQDGYKRADTCFKNQKMCWNVYRLTALWLRNWCMINNKTKKSFFLHYCLLLVREPTCLHALDSLWKVTKRRCTVVRCPPLFWTHHENMLMINWVHEKALNSISVFFANSSHQREFKSGYPRGPLDIWNKSVSTGQHPARITGPHRGQSPDEWFIWGKTVFLCNLNRMFAQIFCEKNSQALKIFSAQSD